ncbi:GNAT family N-acetyltransferase [Erwinia sp.]|uniref:GNAT family N-acetyltransferase n=1 Tax=Erwinia citreus TaxID=558 RepID=UPI003C77AF79
MHTSQRLTLRPVTPEDAKDLFAIYGDPATNLFNPAGPFPNQTYADQTLDKWIAHWQQHGFGYWALTLTGSDEVVGFGGLTVRQVNQQDFINLGYRFATVAWGKGLATEFATWAIDFGFQQLAMTEISATVRENHLASQKVLSKAGMQCTGMILDVEGFQPSLFYTLSRGGA